MSASVATTMHALIDFSDLPVSPARLSAALARLSQPDSLAGLASEVTCITPPGTPAPTMPSTRWRWTTAPGGVEAAHAALTRAGRSGAHLLVLSAPLAAAAEAAVSLSAAFALDPLFGAVHPRFSRDAGRGILPVLDSASRNGDIDPDVPRPTILNLPASYILPEYVSRCFVVRDELLANVSAPDAKAGTTAHLLLAYLRKARRVGFRSVVVNTIVLHLEDSADEQIDVADATPDGHDADTAMARCHFARHVDMDRERRLAALHEPLPKVLIDARNLGDTTNGTTKTFFGLADALHRRQPAWTISLLASSEAAESYGLDTRYPDWELAHELPSGPFAAAFRPSQPWDLSELVGLHRVAAVNTFLMLDTIAWDIVYTAPRRLDATWRFAAQYADALLFISDFSRQRFITRFRVHPDVRTDVCHLSLNPVDYIDPSARDRATGERFWFIVGNHYDHKHVRPTLALLARAFPTTRLAVLGASTTGAHVMKGLASGRADERDVQALYAGADVVIFPSLYEGFGFPIVNALAYGRTVVARDSALLREIAAAYSGPGRIVPFTTPDSLVERLSRLRHGLPVPTVPLGAENTSSYGWRSCADTVVARIDELIQPRSVRREHDRHETVLLLDSWSNAGASGSP